MVLSNKKLQKIMTQPINLIFRHFTSKARVHIWLYEQTELRIEGVILGFDEYMNMVLDDAYEVSKKKKSRKKIGRLLLKGENITLIMSSSTTQGSVGGGAAPAASKAPAGQEIGEG